MKSIVLRLIILEKRNLYDKIRLIMRRIFQCLLLILPIFNSEVVKKCTFSFFFQLSLGSSWPDFINVLGADLVSFEAIDSDDSIRMVSIENIFDIVLISIPGLHPFKLLSSGDSVLVDEVT